MDKPHALEWLLLQTVEWKHPDCDYIFIYIENNQPSHFRYTNNWKELQKSPFVILISHYEFSNYLKERMGLFVTAY